jgi:hypothetical protein
MKKVFTRTTATLMLSLSLTTVLGQDSAKPQTENPGLSLDLNFDLVSRYLWRGLLYSANSNVQPMITAKCSKLSFGTWGSFGISEQYAEFDLFIFYASGPITLMVYDYYAEDENNLSSRDYFNLTNDSTAHQLEGIIIFTGTESFPLHVTAATFFYGADKNNNGSQAYSSYVELSYPFRLKRNIINAFIGGTLNEGLYYDHANIVNMGLTLSRDIKISNNFSIPIKETLAINPANEDIFLVLSLSF